MDKPVFIHCEDCGEVYREIYVLRRSKSIIRRGRCFRCIAGDHVDGLITLEQATEEYERWRK